MLEGWTLDPSALLLAAVVGGATHIISNMQKPGKRQEQLMMMGVAAVGAYFLRQHEQRSQQSESSESLMRTLEARFEERFRTVFTDQKEMKDTLKGLSEKLDAFMLANAPRRRR